MWHPTACKISVSRSILKWIRNEKIFFIVSMNWLHYFRDTIKIISFQERDTNWNFTGYQMLHFVIILIPYINLLNLSWILEEYGAYKFLQSCARYLKPNQLSSLSELKDSLTANEHWKLQVRAGIFKYWSSVLQAKPVKHLLFYMDLNSTKMGIHCRRYQEGYHKDPYAYGNVSATD